MNTSIIEKEYPYVLSCIRTLGETTEQSDIVRLADEAIKMWDERKGWGPFVQQDAKLELSIFDEDISWREKLPLNACWTDEIFNALCVVTTQLIRSWNDDRFSEEVSDYNNFFDLFYLDGQTSNISCKRCGPEGRLTLTLHELELYLASEYAVADFTTAYAEGNAEGFIKNLAAANIDTIHSAEREDITKALKEIKVEFISSSDELLCEQGEHLESVDLYYDSQTKTYQIQI